MIIVNQHFVDREEELEFLEREYKAGRASLVILYGRRRIGKTELVRVFCQGKPHVYYLADKSPPEIAIKRFLEAAAEQLGVDLLESVEARDWETALRLVFQLKPVPEKVVVVLDEFPYLVEVDRNTPYAVQRAWDLYLSKRQDVMLVLVGSSIGMMERLLGYKSPLHGRRTGQWKLGELSLRALREFLPGYSAADLLRVYGAVGAVPMYLSLFEPSKPFYDNVYRLFLTKAGYLYEEAENLLRMELREPRNYSLILRAIAEGYCRFGEIASYTGLDRAAVSRYLDVLQSLDMVSYELPVLAPPKAKRRQYFIRDPYMAFWYRYVEPNRPKIEQGRGLEVLERIKRDYDSYMGRIYARLAARLIASSGQWDRVGRQWGRAGGVVYEIDVLAVNETTHTLLAAEVKWSDLTPKDVLREVEKLRQKVSLVEWRRGDRRERYAIIARSVSGEREELPENIEVYTAEDVLAAC